MQPDYWITGNKCFKGVPNLGIFNKLDEIYKICKFIIYIHFITKVVFEYGSYLYTLETYLYALNFYSNIVLKSTFYTTNV